MFTKSKVYKLCEFGADDTWRVVSEGSAERMRSAFRAAKRDCKGRKFCVAFSMCEGIGESINLPAPKEKRG
jgi:hypothetical protein